MSEQTRPNSPVLSQTTMVPVNDSVPAMRSGFAIDGS